MVLSNSLELASVGCQMELHFQLGSAHDAAEDALNRTGSDVTRPDVMSTKESIVSRMKQDQIVQTN